MGSGEYKDRQGLKDMAAATGNHKYYELVAMPLDKAIYKFYDLDGVKCVCFDWEVNPELIEVVW